jgi:hypothetical protein
VKNGDDGVVEYSSAHLQQAVSELVVRSGHSNQSNPQTIAEVRRILLLHLKESCDTGMGCADGIVRQSVERANMNGHADYRRYAGSK